MKIKKIVKYFQCELSVHDNLLKHKNMKKLKLITILVAINCCSLAQSLTVINNSSATVHFRIYALDGTYGACGAYKSYYDDVPVSTTFSWSDPCDFLNSSTEPETWDIDPSGYGSGCPSFPSGWMWTQVDFNYIETCSSLSGNLRDVSSCGGTNHLSGYYGPSTCSIFGNAIFVISGGNVTVTFN